MIQRQLQLAKKELLSFNDSRKGFGVVEIVVSAAIFLLFITAFVGVIIHSGKQIRLAEKKSKATLLAEEGLEVARNIRDGSFGDLVDGTHGLDVSGGVWNFSGSQDIEDIFVRSVDVSTVSTDTKEISSRVVWDEGLPDEGEIVFTGQLTNWRLVVEQPTMTCAEVCQSLSYTNGTCRQNTNQCRNNGETYESQGDQYCTGGPSADTCCCD